MITKIDFQILNIIQKKTKCRFLDSIMPKISMLGNFGTVWLLSAVLLLNSNKYKGAGESIICGLALGVLIGNLLLKHIFARPRPFRIDGTKKLLIKEPPDYSFPSGHTVSSVAAACILMHANLTFGIIAAVLCLMIIFSRMYLFVHYPSDILGGIGLGIIISAFVLNLNL